MEILNKILGKIHSWIGVRPSTVAKEVNHEVLTPRPPKTIKKTRSKVNNTSIYLYYPQYDRLYFKTKSGKRPLKITAKESVNIVLMYKDHKTTEEIFVDMDFYHDISISTLKQFLVQYDKGLMDVALSWICDNHIDNIETDKNSLVKYLR